MKVKEWEGDVVFLHEVGQGRRRPLLRHPGGAAGRPARRGGVTRPRGASDAYLTGLNPDEMTPREALEALYELKRRLAEPGKN
jgi:DNA mismatch repair protein MutS